MPTPNSVAIRGSSGSVTRIEAALAKAASDNRKIVTLNRRAFREPSVVRIMRRFQMLKTKVLVPLVAALGFAAVPAVSAAGGDYGGQVAPPALPVETMPAPQAGEARG